MTASESATGTTLRIVVADDHAVVREGIRHVLERAEGLEVVAEAADGAEALAAVAEHAPDILVLDISMPELTGLEVTQRLRADGRQVGIVILSMFDDPEYVLQAVRSGADGYLLKDAGPAELRDAVLAVHDGREYLSERVTHQLSVALRSELEQEQRRSRLEQLTPREREVLVRVTRGRTAREIAEEFGISHRTVETHRERVMSKLRIRTIAGLTRFVLEAGIEGE
ncbi:response regulator transcription factor [Gemmatimonadota bacterium DH-20]|uniref:Response regulator transcription factor n=1 Tax=Gaopeijia maritima TaxID=3119007 RepID=A0ABU9E710_9BACT